jgi:hypothetical protein
VILIALAILCVISVPLTGGSIALLAQLRLRWVWAAPFALAAQVVIVTIAPSGNATLHEAIHVATYALVLSFLWANRHIAGMRIIGAGSLSNSVAIIANGGVMPASRTAQRIAGLKEGGGFHNSAALLHPHLLWLGDIIPAPGPLPNVLSIGDCTIFTGMLILLHIACRRPSTGNAAVAPAAVGSPADRDGALRPTGRHSHDAPAVEGGEGATSADEDMRSANPSNVSRSPSDHAGEVVVSANIS